MCGLAYLVLGWDTNASWLLGLPGDNIDDGVYAVMAVMLETGLDKTAKTARRCS